ncbi:MAG: hypothetical protein QM741_16735 [Rudaea sp.]|uniref:hypothetical protein n=1 Tax=Rudaea sp. TaxID=2136325 RepID=UPI0039E71AA7
MGKALDMDGVFLKSAATWHAPPPGIVLDEDDRFDWFVDRNGNKTELWQPKP